MHKSVGILGILGLAGVAGALYLLRPTPEVPSAREPVGDDAAARVADPHSTSDPAIASGTTARRSSPALADPAPAPHESTGTPKFHDRAPDSAEARGEPTVERSMSRTAGADPAPGVDRAGIESPTIGAAPTGLGGATSRIGAVATGIGASAPAGSRMPSAPAAPGPSKEPPRVPGSTDEHGTPAAPAPVPGPVPHDDRGAPGPATVTMVRSGAEIAVGERVSVAVRIDAASDLGHAPFHVTFDPAVLRFEGAEEGAFLGSDGVPTAFFASPTSDGNAVVVGLSRLGQAPGVGGAGELCVLHFVAVGAGDAALGFSRAKVKDAANRAVPAVFGAAAVSVR